ncbi:MAG: mobile mystery protein A [Hyphomicrobiaceae bacterium]
MKSTIRQRARQRLDERLIPLKPENRLLPPPKGWIRAIRDALGMTGPQFGVRLGIKPQSVADIEKSEATGSIQLKTLSRAAEALDCTLVYALVPKTSLEGAVEARARRIALKELQRVAHTMKLEDQSVGDAALEERIAAYVRDVIKDRDLWANRA